MTGRRALPVLAGFGLSLALGAAALFGVQTAPALWSTTACDALSPPWLWLAGTGAALALGALALKPESLGARLVLALGIGTAGVAGFAALFPACLHGPFTGMPDLVRLHWLERVREMQPLPAMLAERPAEGLAFAGALFAAVIAATLLAIRDAGHRRALAVAGLFLAVGAVQTVFRMRGLYVACAFVPMIAGICLDRALAAAGQATLATGIRLALLISALALNSNVWLVSGRLVELAVHRAGGTSGEDAARTDAARNAAEVCSEPAALRPLDALAPGTVLAPIDLGPYLLAHTHHSVVAAPYHRAITGLVAGIEAFRGDEAELRRQAERTGAAYLVLCPGKDDAATQTAFATRLARGEAAAGWLEPVAMPGSALKVWRIR